jgi:BMFP domain-containing protein YqiC
MLKSQFFEEISAKLSAVAESGPAKDIEKNMRALLVQGFTKLDLVTREEFDIQVELLARTREQLSALETRVAELETQRDIAAQ